MNAVENVLSLRELRFPPDNWLFVFEGVVGGACRLV